MTFIPLTSWRSMCCHSSKQRTCSVPPRHVATGASWQRTTYYGERSVGKSRSMRSLCLADACAAGSSAVATTVVAPGAGARGSICTCDKNRSSTTGRLGHCDHLRYFIHLSRTRFYSSQLNKIAIQGTQTHVANGQGLIERPTIIHLSNWHL